MGNLSSRFYNFITNLPYKIHPSFHFWVYKFLVDLGLGEVCQDVVVKYMVKYIKKGDCIIDIGANRGTYAYSMSKAVGKKGKVYSFEPNPVIARELKNNLKHTNVIIENLAVSSTAEDKVFYRHTKGAGPTSSLEFFDVLEKAGELEKTVVKCATLDAYCRLNKIIPTLIKIDVEGHEFEVIKGAEATIIGNLPYIVFEFIEELWEEKNIKQIFELLSPAYDLIRIEDGADAMDAYLNYKPHCYSDFRKSRVVNISCIPKSGYIAFRQTIVSKEKNDFI